MLPVLLDSRGVLVCIRGIRALLLFLASFLQEPALLHGWIEHALLPPDYTDLSGVFINSSAVAAARVCIILQMKNVPHNSHGHADLSKQRRRGREKRQSSRRRASVAMILTILSLTKQAYQYIKSLLINFTWWPLPAKEWHWHTNKI